MCMRVFCPLPDRLCRVLSLNSSVEDLSILISEFIAEEPNPKSAKPNSNTLPFNRRAPPVSSKFPHISSILRKNPPNRAQILCPLTTRKDFHSPRPGQLLGCAGNVLVPFLQPQQEALIRLLWKPRTSKLPNHTDVCGAMRAACDRGPTESRRAHTISSNHAQRTCRSSPLHPQLNSASSSPAASVRPLIDAPSCICARRQSGRATPPAHGSPKERAEGLRKRPIL
jgi:hypothetical protein